MDNFDFDFIERLLGNEEEAQGFTIDSDNKADWAIEQILTAVAERDRLTRIANDRIAELNKQKADISEKTDRNTQFLTDKLFEYFQTVKPSSITKTQTTFKLLSGKLVQKKQQPEYVRDEAAMIDWARASAPDYIKVEERLNWGDLKKQTTLDGEAVVLADTGEIIPGVVAKARPDVFEVAK